MRFEDLDLEYEVLDGLEAMNFVEATPIQEKTIPLLLEGHDLIACAQTGTGKTAAFLLPILNRIIRGEVPQHKVNALIIVPTRELALQIEQQVDGFSYFFPISSISIYGGTDGITFAQQQRSLERGTDIVIATPGRLLALLNLESKASLSEISYFVLDEADRMLDMGFMDDILQIKSLLPSSCQTVMFSATMPKKIKAFAKTILHKPKEVEIAISRPPESIQQLACMCLNNEKAKAIDYFLQAHHPIERAIIFCSSKLKCREVEQLMKGLKIACTQMHSDLDQSKREQVLRDFRSGTIAVLIATDIVARGIDIDNIQLVINYDVPRDAEDYIHRIGRTARGQNERGCALTLVTTEDLNYFDNIEYLLGKHIQRLPISIDLGETEIKSKGFKRRKKTQHRRKQRATK